MLSVNVFRAWCSLCESLVLRRRCSEDLGLGNWHNEFDVRREGKQFLGTGSASHQRQASLNGETGRYQRFFDSRG
jgi:hypothetical protein